MNVASKQMFDFLRRALPDLPQHVTRLVLTLDVDKPPVIDVKYLVKIEGLPLVEESEQFEITRNSDDIRSE
jgi:hypothetical protein